MNYNNILFTICITFMYISFTTSLPILRHQPNLKTTKKLQNMIENTLLEIGQLRDQAEQSVDIPSPGATGVAAAPAVANATVVGSGTVGSNSNKTSNSQETVASTKLAENRVKGITQKAQDAADKATVDATNKLTNKLFNQPKETFGDFKGDTTNLFDHDAELALNYGNKNPLVAVDEAELKNKPEENPTGGAEKKTSATGGEMGTTGATGASNSATGNANSGVVGSSTGNA